MGEFRQDEEHDRNQLDLYEWLNDSKYIKGDFDV